MSHIVLNGDNIDVLKKYPDNYFDAVVTDPPYGLGKEPDAAELMKSWVETGYHEVKGSGFMGKEWDAFVPQPIFWKEVFRVLKHGGHVLAFYGTRTYDWGVMAMRFAGFEVRDTIYWHYGSGFPKSHNISKAIDKMPKANNRLVEFSELLKEKRNQLNLSISEADDLICGGSTMYNFLEGRNINGVLKIYPPNKDFYEKIKSQYKIEGWDDIIENNLDIIGLEKGNFGFQADGKRWNEERELKEATTKEAKLWDGWGSALKPASEPIVMARKPLEKGLSIAENVLKYGTGAINIDGCRIGFKDEADYKESTQKNQHGDFGTQPMTNNTTYGDWSMVQPKNYQPTGRFPANLIMTHHPECECNGIKKVKAIKGGKGTATMNSGMGKNGIYGAYSHEKLGDNAGGLGDENGEETIEDWNCHPECPIRIMDEQSGESRSGKNIEIKGTGGIWSKSSGLPVGNQYGDKGGASRFFYCAKASKSERNKGLEGFEEKEQEHSTNMICGNCNKPILNGRGDTCKCENKLEVRNKAKNFHPTVKPVKLMQYLVRLVTPLNGVVLDPFCGSGTTGIACKLEGFQFVGIEQDPEYTKIAEARIKNYVDEQEEIKPKQTTENKEISQGSLF